MTPQQRNWAQIVSATVAVLLFLGGLFAFGSSLMSADQVTKTRLDGLEKQQDRIYVELREINRKIDERLPERGRR